MPRSIPGLPAVVGAGQDVSGPHRLVLHHVGGACLLQQRQLVHGGSL